MRAVHAAFMAALVAAPMVSQAQMSKAPKIDDPAIVGIFAAANQWDVNTGTLGSTKATRQDVKDFGKMLATVHADVLKQAQDLAKKLGVTPTPVAKDFALKLDYEATMKKLKDMPKGPEFDKAFLQHEIAYHKAVIDAVTNTSLPAIQNAELKKFVQGVAPAFVAHMNAAQALLDKQ
jgi:putative membrane protein